MQDIQFTKNGIRLLAILLAFICLPLLSFCLSTGNDSTTQGSRTADTNLDSVSASSAGKDACQSMVYQNQLVDLLANDTNFFPNMQRLLSWENKSRMTTFYGLSYSRFFRTTPGFMSLSRTGQISVCKIKYFLIAPCSPNAPPYIPA